MEIHICGKFCTKYGFLIYYGICIINTHYKYRRYEEEGEEYFGGHRIAPVYHASS
jgi:hypothetical protein